MKPLHLPQKFAAGHRVTNSHARQLEDEGLIQSDEYGSMIITAKDKALLKEGK